MLMHYNAYMTSAIRTARKARKVTLTQLGDRLGITQSSAARLEQSEERGAITLASLSRAAEALGYEFCYTFRSLHAKKSRKKKRTMPGSVARQGRSSRASTVSSSLRREEREAYSRLNVQERLHRACLLSDFTRELRLCSKKRC